MRRIVGPGEVRLVAAVAGGGQVIEVVIRMALRALQGGMRAGQGVIRVQRVIEGGDRRPCGVAVAGVACGRESRGRVAGVGGSVEVRLVATDAGGGNRRVVVVGVALRAGQRSVRTGQREHRRVVERGRIERGGVVAERAVRWEAAGNVVRVSSALEILLVAAVAGRRQGGVVVVGVARRAGHGGMRPRQRERGVVVIEGRASPVGRAVAHVACGREAGRGVIGIVGAVVIRLVATVAGRRQGGVIAVRMARCTGDGGVRTSQRKH